MSALDDIAKAAEDSLAAIQQMKTMHPAVASVLQFFVSSHLPPNLQAVAKPFEDLAHLLSKGPQNPETTRALTKLLESKDCAVRAVIHK